MPRTKVVKKPKTTQDSQEKELQMKCVAQHIQNKKKELLAKLQVQANEMLSTVKSFTTEQRCRIPYKYLNMTVSEIDNPESLDGTVSVRCISKEDLLNVTKSIRKERKTVKRSTSFVDDEGYLTAESVNSGGRKSRSKAKTIMQSSRKTRSLSRTNTLKTPANKVTPPNSYGLVTPKCKPDTPQILLRRPKNGEVALSMQGSPLYTASVVSENMANINIPLVDGRMLTLQPKRGLRVSQIPTFDPETLQQLNMLRENLSKVCAANSMKDRSK